MRRMINIVGLVLISILVTVIVVNSFAQVEIQPEGDEIYYVKKIYVVKKGDTISDLRSIIGVDFRVEGEIEPGKTINFFVPKKNWTGSEVYVVKKGDTPEKIAQKLGVPGYKLLEWNPEMGCRFIYVGQGLIYKTKGEFEKGLKELETETKKETKKLKNEIEKGLKELEAEIKKDINYLKEVIRGKIIEKNRREKNNILPWIVLNLLFGVLALFFIAWILFDLRIRERKETYGEEREKSIPVKIEGKDYWYIAPLDERGRYASLHKNKKGSLLYFKRIEDLKKSLKKSLKNRPSLIEKMIETGRLIVKEEE